MNRFTNKCYIILALSLAIVSCSKVPSYVIPPSEMASLLADIHVGEAVVDLNRTDYYNDSCRQVMLQSVLIRHGITKQELDTSFYWYGHNISYYMDVYDKTIEILERRIAETGNRIAAENISIAGDSVDVWAGAQSIALNRLSPSLFLTFSLSQDENWERGDSYTWRAKFSNCTNAAKWGIIADYADGSKETMIAEPQADGWNEVKFISDSTKQAVRIYGFLNANPRSGTTIWADSIMLIRNRVTPESYTQHYRQQKIRPKNLIDLKPEEITIDSVL